MVGNYSIFLAYFLSVIVAHFLVRATLCLIRHTSGVNLPYKELRDLKEGGASEEEICRRKREIDRERHWESIWLGTTERAIVTSLVIFSPGNLALFIGGWVAAKFAAGWQRWEGEEYASASMTSLVGSALSISAAILAGALAAPDFLSELNKADAVEQTTAISADG